MSFRSWKQIVCVGSIMVISIHTLYPRLLIIPSNLIHKISLFVLTKISLPRSSIYYPRTAIYRLKEEKRRSTSSSFLSNLPYPRNRVYK